MLFGFPFGLTRKNFFLGSLGQNPKKFFQPVGSAFNKPSLEFKLRSELYRKHTDLETPEYMNLPYTTTLIFKTDLRSTT